MAKTLKLTHAQLVAYLSAGLIEKSIRDNLNIDYTEVINLIDNATCDLADENGYIDTGEISDSMLKKTLKNILPDDFLDEIIENAFVITWMYSQDF